ncbi:Sensor histidine kinase MtrB [Microbacterium esteraromaticum]|uniref:Sensor histidine kinase MtrB n=1 Tax=Microbacterium esteraromaticum TaxID=57043 RepID=A0A1R4JFK4_9MICO|nr:MtrAB system histidine kinase MtrB [Microbacterium esteraromaticum]SJN30890.1 Sensor histidine kinase MtrB [Microbacterium esteraromaticum]
MIATNATRVQVAIWRDPRQWADALATIWRRSMRFRTIAITLLLTSLAIFITCVIMALVIRNDLFESRKDEALHNARAAVSQAQTLLDSGQSGDDRSKKLALWREAQNVLARTASSNRIAGFPATLDGDGFAPPGFVNKLSSEQLSNELRTRVIKVPGRQAWQSIALPQDDGTTTAGIVVGQQLVVPDAGSYDVYIAYDLADADETLIFVQRTLWLAGISLVAILAAISWLVLRSVSTPIIEAAETSARLAAGDLEVRLPVRGEDELATLARSFNAMADSIESQIGELAELSLVQQRFVSDVSHELRTPLTTIRLAAEMINDNRDEFDPTTARTAELLHTQVQRFETLLTDLLEISRYDAGSVQLEVEATSLAQLAEEIVEQLRPLAATHETELRMVAPGGYSPVDMDPRRVRRVLRNLVGNAIEHGEGQPIVVTVDSNQHAVAIGVRDFGLGMRSEDAAHVFDRFWRADPSRKRTIGGTGLGLSIALGDAKLHGGTLAVWSELGVGTNFVLTLPRGGGDLSGPSPVPLEPQESILDIANVTEPIVLRRDDDAPSAGSRGLS